VIDVDRDEELPLYTPRYLNGVPQPDHAIPPGAAPRKRLTVHGSRARGTGRHRSAHVHRMRTGSPTFGNLGTLVRPSTTDVKRCQTNPAPCPRTSRRPKTTKATLTSGPRGLGRPVCRAFASSAPCRPG
jgi:hypothetical protein